MRQKRCKHCHAFIDRLPHHCRVSGQTYDDESPIADFLITAVILGGGGDGDHFTAGGGSFGGGGADSSYDSGGGGGGD